MFFAAKTIAVIFITAAATSVVKPCRPFCAKRPVQCAVKSLRRPGETRRPALRLASKKLIDSERRRGYELQPPPLRCLQQTHPPQPPRVTPLRLPNGSDSRPLPRPTRVPGGSCKVHCWRRC